MAEGRENRVDALNILRVLAMFSVFFLHTTLFEPEIADLFMRQGMTFLWRTPAWSAVWIFLILSGYLAGKNYASGRYTLDRKGVWSYYRKRVLKVILPTFSFIFLAIVLCAPDFIVENTDVLIRFATFTYRAVPDFGGIGATWYVFTLSWLYLITPLVGWCLHKLREHRKIIWGIMLLLAFAELLWRMTARYFQLEWNQYVYCAPAANLDLYLGGMIAGYLKKPKETAPQVLKKGNAVRKWTAGGCVALLFVSNCYFYNAAHLGNTLGLDLSMYFLQTMWLICVLFYLWVFDDKSAPVAPVSWTALRKNPLRILDMIASISFEFYLFHSLILSRIAQYVIAGRPMTWGIHMELLLKAGVITAVMAAGFRRIFQSTDRRKQSIV